MTPEASPAFQMGPVAFFSILAGSIVVVALALEQLYTFWRLLDGAKKLGAEVSGSLAHGQLAAVRSSCERAKSPVADIFMAALNQQERAAGSPRRAADRGRQRFALWMRRRLWALGTMGALAPFVGLFGTVIGIIRAFRDIAASGAGGFSVVAAGVSEALVATAGGIFVAVLAVVFYNYFSARGARALIEVKLIVDEFLEQLEALQPEDA